MIKATTYLLCFGLFLTSCGRGRSINIYETKDRLSANLSLAYARTYAGEQLKIKVNGAVIYQMIMDSSLYQGMKLFNVPDSIKTVEIESYYKGEKQISSSYKNTASLKRISIIMGYPHPKGVTPTYARNKEGFLLPIQKKEWLQLPLDSIDRNIYIAPDTSKGLIILQEKTN